MTKVYLVVPYKYEYNDEIYYQQGAKIPQNGYKSKEKALFEVTEKNMKIFRGLTLSDYAYDLNEIIPDIEAFNQVAQKVGLPLIPEDRWQQITIPASISDEHLFELMQHIDLTFYQVVEVDIEGVK